LAERGYDRLYGARPLARVIQEYVKKPLAEELLFGKLARGGAGDPVHTNYRKLIQMAILARPGGARGTKQW